MFVGNRGVDVVQNVNTLNDWDSMTIGMFMESLKKKPFNNNRDAEIDAILKSALEKNRYDIVACCAMYSRAYFSDFDDIVRQIQTGMRRMDMNRIGEDNYRALTPAQRLGAIKEICSAFYGVIASQNKNWEVAHSSGADDLRSNILNCMERFKNNINCAEIFTGSEALGKKADAKIEEFTELLGAIVSQGSSNRFATSNRLSRAHILTCDVKNFEATSQQQNNSFFGRIGRMLGMRRGSGSDERPQLHIRRGETQPGTFVRGARTTSSVRSSVRYGSRAVEGASLGANSISR